jgi:hypothetical protein
MEQQPIDNQSQQFVYVFIYGMDWEDTVIILSKEEAIEISKKYPNSRVEIFSKNNNVNTKQLSPLNFGYTPTYNYYKNGELVF